jgi:hypothetical protein
MIGSPYQTDLHTEYRRLIGRLLLFKVAGMPQARLSGDARKERLAAASVLKCAWRTSGVADVLDASVSRREARPLHFPKWRFLTNLLRPAEYSLILCDT